MSNDSLLADLDLDLIEEDLTFDETVEKLKQEQFERLKKKDAEKVNRGIERTAEAIKAGTNHVPLIKDALAFISGKAFGGIIDRYIKMGQPIFIMLRDTEDGQEWIQSGIYRVLSHFINRGDE
jgi:hypothetical protein